jgi:hypothetical protein
MERYRWLEQQGVISLAIEMAPQPKASVYIMREKKPAVC